MKKALAIMLTAAMGCGMLSGCSGGGSTGGGAVQQTTQAAQAAGDSGSSSGETSAAPAVDASMYEVTEPITIQWWHSIEDQNAQTVEDVVSAFNSSQDLITVEAVYVGSYGQVNEALVAAHARGITVFHEVGELRVKESDRLAAIIEGLAQLGVDAWEEGDDLLIEGNLDLTVPEGLVFNSHGDHRLAMTWALVGACGSVPVNVTDFTCVAVSYPDFLADLKELVR